MALMCQRFLSDATLSTCNPGQCEKLRDITALIRRTSSNRRAVLNNRRKRGAGPLEKQGSATPKRGALPQEDKDRETPPGDHALNTESADQRLGGKGAAGATQQLRCTCTYTCNLHPKGALLATIGHHGRLASGTTGLSLKRLDNIVAVQLESRFSS